MGTFTWPLTAGASHDFTEPLTLDLVGACTIRRREWDGGFPVLRHAYFTIPTIIEFLRYMGRGDSLRLGAENARRDHQDILAARHSLTPDPPIGAA